MHGGFGGAPKFPVGPVLRFLASSPGDGRALALRTMRLMGASALRDPVEGGFFRYATRADWSEPHYERMLTDNAQLLSASAGDGRDLALRTMRLMGASALRDPVEGGFFRYATRADWSEPHYERMLTDNAQLLSASAELARSFPAEVAPEAIARGIIRFLAETMQLAGGGFASAQDSESIIDGVRNEGGYYHADAEARRTLPPPALDEKVLTGWNGLAIGALATRVGHPRRCACRGGRRSSGAIPARRITCAPTISCGRRATGRSRVRGRPSRTAACSRAVARTGARHRRRRVRRHGAVVDRRRNGAADTADAAHEDADGPVVAPLPFRAPGGADPVLAARGLALDDDPGEGAMPSGVSACAHAAWTLWLLGAGDRYRVAAEAAMQRVAGAALARPIAFGSTLRLMARFVAPVVQLVTVVPDGPRAADAGKLATDEAGTDELVRATRGHEASVTAIVTESQARAFADAGFELFEATRAGAGACRRLPLPGVRVRDAGRRCRRARGAHDDLRRCAAGLRGRQPFRTIGL